MRRRRQKNPLLMRIIGISILVHIVALPILAHFGAFKKIQRQFIETRMVVLPPPPPEKEKPEIKKPQRVAHKLVPRVRRGATTTHHTQQAAHRSNLSQPKVVASTGSGGDDSNGPTVDANGTGVAGQLPTPQADTKPPTVKADTPPKPQPTPPPKGAAPQVAQNSTPKVEAPPPAPKVEAPKPPVYTEAVPTNAPQPTIPDDLRGDALDTTCVVDFIVGADGAPTEVKMAHSTGSDELDRIALDAAKQWRFKPATRDGQPIESRVRLHIEFQVS